jgi:hypothetical protein
MGAAPRGRRYGGGSIKAATFTQPSSHDREHEFQVLFAEPGPGAGPAARTVLDRLADRGLRVVTARTRAALQSTIAGHAGPAAVSAPPAGTAGPAGPAGSADAAPPAALPFGVAVLSWELFDSPGQLATMIDEIGHLSAPPPVVVVSEQADEQAVPSGLAGRTAGTFWLHADSPHFVADQVEWLVRTFALRSQVLGALSAGLSAS